MSSILNSQSMFLATAMAVSGSVILLAFRLQKSRDEFSVNPIPESPEALPRSCISLDRKKKEKKKKRVQFADDVVDPIGNSEEYRRRRRRAGEVKQIQMPENRMALYNGILRDRLLHRLAYSY